MIVRIDLFAAHEYLARRALPFEEAHPRRNTPSPISSLKSIDVPAPTHRQRCAFDIHAGKQIVRLGMRGVALQVAAMIIDGVLCNGLVFAMQGKGPIGKLLRITEKNAVIIDGIGVIGAQQQLSIQPVYPPAVTHETVVDLLTIAQFKQRFLNLLKVHFSPASIFLVNRLLMISHD
jgi:hypothetical protein